jgi:hypothetical protein
MTPPKLLAPPKFPPWELCPQCGEQLAVTINGIAWCTSAQCDPRGNSLRAVERHFQKHPAAEPENSNPEGAA